jgi:glycosyltransferase involved in cell wall biosynthesis
MRLLYVNYGPQSGVTPAVTEFLRREGIEVLLHDPVTPFLYGRRVAGLPVPSFRPSVVAAVLRAALRFGRTWRDYYLHTCYAFDRLSDAAGEAIRRLRPDVVLQAGVLHGPGRPPEVPYYLLLDNTRAIAERYPDVPGLPEPVPFEGAWRARERSIYRGAECIFTLSRHVARSLERDYGVPRARVRVVGAGPIIAAHRDLSAVPREPALLFVGTSFAQKGGHELLAAFARVQRERPRARLWLAGGHRVRPALPGVTCFGYVTRERLAPLYARATAFVLPTLREPFGLSYLEAMSFGLPCIGTPHAAVPEIIEHGVTGLLTPPRDVPALARAMARLLDHPEQARAMGAAGRARVSAHFQWRRTVHRMADVLGREVRSAGS